MSANLLHRLARNAIPRARVLSTSAPTATKRHWRPATAYTAIGVAAVVAGTLGAIYPPIPLTILFPRAAPGPPNPDSPESKEYCRDLEKEMLDLPVLKELRESADHQDWYETRPYQGMPDERRVNSLTAGTLRGPGKLAVTPLIRVRHDESESMVFLHLGRGLCGHDGIIHGGLLATLLDESLGRTVRDPPKLPRNSY